MPDFFHLLSIWLHILAATVWIGGMAALGLLLVPLLRQERFEDVARPLLYQSALRFRWIGWGALGVLVATGLVNVRAQGVPWSAWIDPGFWTTAWGAALGWKILLVGATLSISAVHDFHFGPKAIRLMREAPESAAAERMRWRSSWLGRLTLLLSLAILWFAILLPRGGCNTCCGFFPGSDDRHQGSEVASSRLLPQVREKQISSTQLPELMAETIPTVSTDTFATQVNDPDHEILDVRPIAAYNGWSLQGESRGGHVPGAKSLPLQWTQYMDWVEVLDEKNLSAETPVTVYGYAPENTAEMVDKLNRLGFEAVGAYDGLLQDWVPDSDRPLRRLERHEQLVYPEWLHALLSGKQPLGMRGEEYVLCHAHFNYRQDYEDGHIPGAIPLNTNDLESPETWNRRPPEELKATLEDHGIRHDTTVVLYGRFSYPTYDQDYPAQSAGHLGAMRCAALMLYAGVDDVKILNGGINTWESAGYEVSTEDVSPTPVSEFGAEVPAHPEYMLTLDEAKRLLASDDGDLVSVRSWAEFIGERSGYHYIDATGRIPGAVFGNCGSDAYHMENYRNFDYTTREFPEIAETWAEMGITPDKHIAFYCGTGWRGSEAFMNAYLMGWPNIAVYDGGWYEWSSHPETEIATGVPE